MIWRRARHVGWILVTIGILAVLFTAYQLWGTGLTTMRAQARLRDELAGELPHSRDTAAAKGGAGAGAASAARAAGAGTAARARHTQTRQGPLPPAQVAPPASTPGPGQPVGTIDIPSIGLDMVIVQGVTASELAMGPGHYPGTPLPGEAGDAAIAGHRTTYLHPFYDLTAVSPGDPIVVTTPQGEFTFLATGETTVAPTDVGAVGPSTVPMLTLTTCNPRYSAATRLVLRATLARSTLFSTGARSSRAPGGGSAAARGRATTRHPTRGPVLAQTEVPPPPPSGVLPALVWGLACVAVATVTLWLGRRVGRGGTAAPRRRVALYLCGAVVFLVVLFGFFASFGPLLPSTF